MASNKLCPGKQFFGCLFRLREPGGRGEVAVVKQLDPPGGAVMFSWMQGTDVLVRVTAEFGMMKVLRMVNLPR